MSASWPAPNVAPGTVVTVGPGCAWSWLIRQLLNPCHIDPKTQRPRTQRSGATHGQSIGGGGHRPYGADWHRKYHLLRRHLETGTPLTPDTTTGSINLGSWATRQLTRWKSLEEGQRRLLAALDLTPATSTLTPRPAARRAFAETVQLLELFLYRERRCPTARETITVDGDTVKIGPWFAKARAKHRAGQLPEGHGALVACLFNGDWTDDRAEPGCLV
ncbi:helicase associated domain-containing protein [Streptomyces sp. NRRL B-24720]|uniref:helicase associated domain-containing protein n=1 Tax=Streptomyces sp. NRRL B-24720 TaxID=1476876 RepID=UPI00068A3312|nr:helicase associated domain-containing protein [Streptomyces sp. NRRL B-24720]